jgi:hypothetical protein
MTQALYAHINNKIKKIWILQASLTASMNAMEEVKILLFCSPYINLLVFFFNTLTFL